jgi:hypothetical protein
VRVSSAITRSVGNAVLLLIACCSAAQALGESGKGPNILILMADDPKWEAVKQTLKMQLENEQLSTGDPRITGNFEEVFYGK